MVRDDNLSFFQKLIGYPDAFAEKPTGILAEVKNQALHLALGLKLLKRLGDLMFRSLLKSGNVDITDSWPDHEVYVHAVARNLVAYDAEIDGLFRTFAEHRNLDRRAFGSFKKFSHIAGAHIVRGFAVHRDNYIARSNAGAIGGGAGKWRNHNDLVIPWSNLHTDAVVLTPLLLAQSRVRLRIEEIGVRIEHP